MAVYHILPESEPFSRRAGGPTAHWVGSVLAAAGLQHESIVVCPAAETGSADSWHLPYIWVAPEMVRVGAPPGPLRHPMLWERRVRVFARLLRGFTARLRPQDAVFVHNRPELALAMIWAQERAERHNPVVLSLYDARLAEAPRALVRHLASNLDRVVFPSEFLYHQAYERHRLHLPVSILPFGADEEVFYPPEPRPLLPAPPPETQPSRILYVGPVAERHGLHVLLDAMRLLARRGVEAELRVIERRTPGGDTSRSRETRAEEKYRRSLRAMRGTNASFEPYRGYEEGPAQVAEAMRSSVAVCCPALTPEAFCLCSVEAMACAVPVAASCVGGLPDMFTEGGGVLTPPGDPDALARALERLLGKTGLARSLRRDGRESFLRNYRWRAIAAQYTDLLQSLPYERGLRLAATHTVTGRFSIAIPIAAPVKEVLGENT